MMLNCQPALGVIASAYLIFAGGKTHPAYVAGPAGTVIEGGWLTPFVPGTCITLDLGREEWVVKAPPGQRVCTSDASVDNGRVVMEWEGATIGEFTNALLNGPFVDRRIVDRTGLTGRYDIRLELALPPASADPGAAAADDATIYTALREQRGLRLQPAKGIGEFLVVDQIDRPDEN